MTTTRQLAKHFRDVFFGGNWTWVNLKDTLYGITVEQATTEVKNLNSIARLVFHIHYYINPMLRVLNGGTLDGVSDKFSFDLPALESEEEWQAMVNRVLADAELFASAVENLDDSILNEIFADPKYGTYHRNLLGVIEHTHYHLGQISLLKKYLSA